MESNKKYIEKKERDSEKEMKKEEEEHKSPAHIGGSNMGPINWYSNALQLELPPRPYFN